MTLIAWSGANPGGRMRLPEREQRRRNKKVKREKTTATLLMILLLASALSVTLVPVLARGGSPKGILVEWDHGGETYRAIFRETASGIIHQWRYEPNHLHAVYKPFDEFPNDPGDGWVLAQTSYFTGGYPALLEIFGDYTQWWVYSEYQS